MSLLTMSTALTVCVFCAVSAVMTEHPNVPNAEKVFRSACIPAPPPESDPAMVRQMGNLLMLIPDSVFVLVADGMQPL